MPTNCLLCETRIDSGQTLCPPCLESLPYNHSVTCHYCALPLDNPASTACGHCQLNPPAWDFVLSAFRYSHPIDKLVQAMKFREKLDIAYLLGTLMYSVIKNHYFLQRRSLPELIIPVPLHTSRLRERGFNQALELARPLSQHFAIPIDAKNCLRTVATTPQSLLSGDDRSRNLKNVFHVKQTLSAQHVVIIDDVMTTGHTIDEITRTLRKSGVQQIDVWLCGRTEK
ncbi:MAG: ComF family protein [Gammaproteobacteria bacterium]|nr:ComF family protein [Gammaproteobacteria bacterium]